MRSALDPQHRDRDEITHGRGTAEANGSVLDSGCNDEIWGKGDDVSTRLAVQQRDHSPESNRCDGVSTRLAVQRRDLARSRLDSQRRDEVAYPLENGRGKRG
jgi:hypothetical protein